MIGTILNVLGIAVGAIAGITRRQPLSASTDSMFKVMLGVFTVFYGLRLSWLSLNGSPTQVLKQILILIISLSLGKMLGRLARVQSFSNQLGRTARDLITRADPSDPNRVSNGFKTCAALYCAAPLGILGAVQDGLSGYFFPLAIKGVMEGVATMGFVGLFGWGVALAALPVLAFQGSISLACLYVLRPFLVEHGLVDSINATGGLLVFSVALVILGLKKIELAEYLPSLAVAPILTWALR